MLSAQSRIRANATLLGDLSNLGVLVGNVRGSVSDTTPLPREYRRVDQWIALELPEATEREDKACIEILRWIAEMLRYEFGKPLPLLLHTRRPHHSERLETTLAQRLIIAPFSWSIGTARNMPDARQAPSYDGRRERWGCPL